MTGMCDIEVDTSQVPIEIDKPVPLLQLFQLEGFEELEPHMRQNSDVWNQFVKGTGEYPSDAPELTLFNKIVLYN